MPPDPPGCSGTGLTLSLLVFFADGVHSPGAGGPVTECETEIGVLTTSSRLSFLQPQRATCDPVLTVKKHESQGRTSLHAARTRKEVALAELRELEVRRKRGDLVPAAAVAREWESILRQVRAAILAVPSRFRARCPHLTAHDAQVLDEELRAALVTLGK